MKRRAKSSIVLPLAPWQRILAQAIDALPLDIAGAVGWRTSLADRMIISLVIPLIDECREPTDDFELLTVAMIRFQAARGRLLFDSEWFGHRAYAADRASLREVGRDVQLAILELLHKATAGHAEQPIAKDRGVYFRPDGRYVLTWQERTAATLGGYRDEYDDDRRDDEEDEEEVDHRH